MACAYSINPQTQSNPTVLKAYPIDSSSPIPTRGQTTSKHIDELFSPMACDYSNDPHRHNITPSAITNPTVLKAYPIDSSSPIPTRGQTTSKHIDETLFSNDMRLQQRSSQTQYNPLCN
ncbi:hypothetical protein CDAR_86281 [Caerostris darwini]|uniref:Uncharacterized protein n=1 Tax=Caerostris darwini TaxID=1538125 RepID=A0AAV4NMP1_9ARAC|nr:hypothetical protein CDAR_86281 [Caerostris darwini]